MTPDVLAMVQQRWTEAEAAMLTRRERLALDVLLQATDPARPYPERDLVGWALAVLGISGEAERPA